VVVERRDLAVYDAVFGLTDGPKSDQGEVA
jgi:hypothetical protein